MKTESAIALGLAALVVGGLVYVRHKKLTTPLPGAYEGFSTSELYLRAAPDHLADINAIVPSGESVRVDATNAPGWVYAYYRQPDGTVVEGYSRAENLAGLGDLVPLDKVFTASTGVLVQRGEERFGPVAHFDLVDRGMATPLAVRIEESLPQQAFDRQWAARWPQEFCPARLVREHDDFREACRYRPGHPGPHKTAYINGQEWT